MTDNWPTLEPWFNETGDNAPSLFERERQHDLMALAVNTLRCLGLKLGVFHVEAKYTTRGPRLIEVNSRMGGGQVRDNNLAVWGVDLVRPHGLRLSSHARLRPLSCGPRSAPFSSQNRH